MLPRPPGLSWSSWRPSWASSRSWAGTTSTSTPARWHSITQHSITERHIVAELWSQTPNHAGFLLRAAGGAAPRLRVELCADQVSECEQGKCRIIYNIYLYYLISISAGPAPPRGVPGHGVAADRVLPPAQPEVLRHGREVLRLGHGALNQSLSLSTPIILYSL